jgi:acetyl esterase/lipase
MSKRLKNIVAALLLLLATEAAEYGQTFANFRPGELWPDDNHIHINAHGGGILYFNHKYYWFGEHKIAGEKGNYAYVGVHCYSTDNLYNWKDEGFALKVDDNPGSLVCAESIIERPKVIYNKKTKQFVMWFHLELKDKEYKAALCGVAVSDKITGPYQLHHTERPDKNALPLNHIVQLSSADSLLRRDLVTGQMSRNMNLFADDDANLIYTSEENSTIHISRLASYYLTTTGEYIRVFSGRYMEDAALFKNQGHYYFVASGCTGWNPNGARSAIADSVLGTWKELGNPCRGQDSALTFHSQSTFVLLVAGKKNALIFMADRWQPANAIDGRYIWLPVHFEGDGFTISWQKEWDLNYFDSSAKLTVQRSYSGNRKEQVLPSVTYTLPGKELMALSEKICFKKINQSDLYLYLLRPAGKHKKLPAIVYFFRGGWVTDDVEHQIPIASWFRDHGIIAIAADYRIKSKHDTTPLESTSNAKSAALVLYNPVLGEGFGDFFFNVHPEFSSIKQVKKGWPPTILSCGTKDRTTPFTGAEKFTSLMKSAGNSCVLIPVKDADHSCDWPVSNPNFLPTLQQMTTFLKQEHLMAR